MRMQLMKTAMVLRRLSIGLLLLLPHWGEQAYAQVIPRNQVVVKHSYFSDNRSIFFTESAGSSVPQTLISVTGGVTEEVTMNGYYRVDATSSATWHVDGVSGASPRVDLEYRYEGGFGLTYRVGVTQMVLSGGVSRENNYDSDFAALALQHEFFDRNTTLSISYAINRDEINTVKLADIRPFPRDASLDAITLSLAQVLSPRMVVQATLFYAKQEGYLAHPENILVFSDGTFGEEVHPESRSRRAVVGRLVRYFETRSALHAAYRYYRDDWGIRSHTLDSKWYQYFGRHWIGRIGYRFYEQSASDFYEDIYDSSPARLNNTSFQTIDGKLRSFTSHLYGIKFITTAWQIPWSFFKETEIDLKFDRYQQSGGYRAYVIEAGLIGRF